MDKIKILLDSTCDRTREQRKEYDLGYLERGVSVDDKTYDAKLDWSNYSVKEFYGWRREGKRVFTSQVQEPYRKKEFLRYLDEGYQILYIGCSGKLSGSVKTGFLVADELKKERPEGKVVVIDACISGRGQGLLGIRASMDREAGRNIDDIAKDIQDNRLKYNQWGSTRTLTYLKNAGRVKASAAFFGNRFGVKPIIISDINGDNYAYKKVRGRKMALQEIADSVERTAVDPENHYLAITHADCEKDALLLRDRILAKGLKFKGIFINVLGPILGASCGPDTIIAFNFGKEVTLKSE